MALGMNMVFYPTSFITLPWNLINIKMFKITSNSAVFVTACSGSQNRKHQSSKLLALFRGSILTSGFSLQSAYDVESVSAVMSSWPMKPNDRQSPIRSPQPLMLIFLDLRASQLQSQLISSNKSLYGRSLPVSNGSLCGGRIVMIIMREIILWLKDALIGYYSDD